MSFGFEGFEKRLEIEFEEVHNEGGINSNAGLRSLSRCELDEMLTAAECTIVSELHNEWFDAYVLSESSLFIYHHCLVLKTCGKTQLLNAVPVLLRHAAALSLQAVGVKYSRGTFIFPCAQPFPYTSFTEETRFLDELFAPMLLHGCRSAHVLDGHPDSGGTNWHIYTAMATGQYVPAPMQTSPSAATAAVKCVNTSPNMALTAGKCVTASLSSPIQTNTYTLEMCMTHLHPSSASHFMNPSGIKSGADMTHDSGISSLLPNAVICDFAFTPCGYSMNGMEKNALSTIHITPEEGHSYASFEVMGYDPYSLDLRALVNRVVACFKPGSLVMSIHASGYGNGRLENMSSSWDTSHVEPRGYVCNSSVRQELAGHGVIAFHTFTRSPFGEGSSVIPQTLWYHSNQVNEWDIDGAYFKASAGFGNNENDDDGGGVMIPWLQQNGRCNSLLELELEDSTLEMMAEGNHTSQAQVTYSPYDQYAHEELETHQSLINSYEFINHGGPLLTIVDSEMELQECYPNAKVILRLKPKSKGSRAELSPNAEELLRKSKKLGLQVVGIAVDMRMESSMTLCAYKGAIRAARKVCGSAQALGMPALKLLVAMASTSLSCE